MHLHSAVASWNVSMIQHFACWTRAAVAPAKSLSSGQLGDSVESAFSGRARNSWLMGPQRGLIAAGEKQRQLHRRDSPRHRFAKTNATAGGWLPKISKSGCQPRQSRGNSQFVLAKAIRADLSHRLDWGIWVLVRHPYALTRMQYTIPREREKWKQNFFRPLDNEVTQVREFKQADFADGKAPPTFLFPNSPVLP